MQLLKIIVMFAFCSVYGVTAEEVCLWESFSASCSAGDVVFIESAFYGRMHESRCINLTDNESNCSSDIRLEIQKQIGKHQSIDLKLYSDVFTKKASTCLHGRMPFLEISYQCTKSISKEVCIEETFRAECLHVPGTVIFIQSALYGRMRSSRCTDFDSRELNCQANVQPYLESLCNKRTECSIKAANDTLKEAIAYCQKSLKPYLEVFYTCVHEFSCPQFSLPMGATMKTIDGGYHIVCEKKTLMKELICRDGKWNTDPEQLCIDNQVQLLVFSSAAGVFLLTAIISVVVCLRRIQKNSQRKKVNGPRRQTESGGDYDDYPESHLRRQGATCGSENEYEYEYEYEYDGQQDDGTYGSYSHVRNTGP